MPIFMLLVTFVVALLAHKASKEARIAVENICGETAVFEDIHIPAVVTQNLKLHGWVN